MISVLYTISKNSVKINELIGILAMILQLNKY